MQVLDDLLSYDEPDCHLKQIVGCTSCNHRRLDFDES